jgi:hypothetical protein
MCRVHADESTANTGRQRYTTVRMVPSAGIRRLRAHGGVLLGSALRPLAERTYLLYYADRGKPDN